MHDPMTVAFEIRYPWRKYGDAGTSEFLRSYRDPFVTIWHVDPERDGSDNSCDWFGTKRPLNEREKALWQAIDNLTHRLGNPPYYPDGPGLYGKDYYDVEQTENSDVGLIGELNRAMYQWRRRSRWRIPVRWHVWHWRVQVHPILAFKRWAFTRCHVCGGRFAWMESGLGTWSGNGPAWFRNGEQLTHMNGVCDAIRVPGVLNPQNLPGARA